MAGRVGRVLVLRREFFVLRQDYGSLGTVVVLLMWLYLSSFIVLVGAELNSEIEQSRADKARCPRAGARNPQGARRS